MAWTRTTSSAISVLLAILGVALIVRGVMKDKSAIWIGSGTTLVALSAVVYFVLSPEGYEDTLNSPAHAKIPNLRVESALDNVNHSRIIANKCNSIYGGAWQMGVQTECGRVRSNPNGF